MKRILLFALLAALSLGLAAAAPSSPLSGSLGAGSAQTDGEKFAAKQPGLSPKSGYYCTHPDDPHPALNDIALQYNWPYADILRWFCEGRFGVGEIKHAFETWVAIGQTMTPNEILALKVELGGWGQVWQQLGVKGNESSSNANSHAKNQ